MKTWTLIGAFLVLLMAGAAQAEGVSSDDIECGNNPSCLHPVSADNEQSL